MITTAKLHFQPESLLLPNGTHVTIRAVRPDDAPRIQAFVARLSPESIYYRFFSTITGLSDAEAARLANVDYEDRMALVATVFGDEGEYIIAVARYARSATLPDRAEFAVVVADDYQKLGIARALIKHIGTYAKQHGIHLFTGTILGGNLRMRQFVKNCGLPSHIAAGEHGEIEVEVHLSEQAPAR